MRSLNILACPLGGRPREAVARNFDQVREKTERYQALLAELAVAEVDRTIGTVIDLPEDLREAIDTWTCCCPG